MQRSYDRLTELLCEVPEYSVEDKLNKNIVAELARKYDSGLINKLLSDKDMKKLFFVESDSGLIFKKDIFLQFVSQKEFLPDSYTAYKVKIGLGTGSDDYLMEDAKMVLNWPYKDCMLEGGQNKEDQKRDEVFFNEILAPDQINTILDDKVFVNWKRYDKDGEHELDKLKTDDNLIIKGNNLVVLHSLKKRFAGKVKLIYIDPPYNTGNDSFNYNDHFNHSSWLTFMKDRLRIAKELLSDDGSIFVQIDQNESHYLKILMDEIFGRDKYVNEIIWYYKNGGGRSNRWFNRKHDNIFWYSKNLDAYYFDPKAAGEKRNLDEGSFGGYFKTDSDGRRYQEVRANGKIYKYYTDELKNADDVWEMGIISQRDKTERITGFSGQKPEKLLDRIIKSTTVEGDIVLDFCLGTGTTAKVAHKLKRQYIGIEQMYYDGKMDPVNGLRCVIDGDGTEYSKEINWTGGGSFVYCNIKNDANVFREKVRFADDKKLGELLEEVLKSSFLSYRVDPKKVSKKEFDKLSTADRKRILIDLVDNNTLYLNYSEINDKSYNISEADKRHNKEFYGEES